nr:MAG TPA: hypothetical protein [Caudoviricetes sp.]
MCGQNRGKTDRKRAKKACGNLFCTLFCVGRGDWSLIISKIQP